MSACHSLPLLVLGEFFRCMRMWCEISCVCPGSVHVCGTCGQQKNLQALGDLPLLFLQTLRGRGGSSFVVSYQEYSLTHSHEQDFGRTWTSTIRDTGEREWGAHRDTEGGWAGVHPHATELCLFFYFSSVTINPRACRRTARELRHICPH